MTVDLPKSLEKSLEAFKKAKGNLEDVIAAADEGTTLLTIAQAVALFVPEKRGK
jgi:hypothetical protein